MTTAIAHAARGELVAAAYVQPAGLVFYALLPVGLIYALRTALFGKPSIPAGLSAQAVIALALGVLLCGWIVKIVLGICVGRLPLGH